VRSGKTIALARSFADLWNDRVPPGAPLVATLPDGTEVRTYRQSAATEMDGAASLFIEQAGCWVPLRNVRPLTDAERLQAQYAESARTHRQDGD
jgi:hypothetical protein